MRQGRRYMEEYRKLRAQHGFLELCKSLISLPRSRSRSGEVHVDAAIFSPIFC